MHSLFTPSFAKKKEGDVEEDEEEEEDNENCDESDNLIPNRSQSLTNQSINN